MSAVIKVAPGQLAAEIRSNAKRTSRAITRGMVNGARRAASYLGSNKGPTPVFDGHLKNAWEMSDTGRGAGRVVSVVNTAPYAGVVERGARPHKVSREGREAIREWVRKKVLLMTTSKVVAVDSNTGERVYGARAMSSKEADGPLAYLLDEIVWGIVKRIERSGQQATNFVLNSLPTLQGFLDMEVQASLDRAAGGNDK